MGGANQEEGGLSSQLSLKPSPLGKSTLAKEANKAMVKWIPIEEAEEMQSKSKWITLQKGEVLTYLTLSTPAT